MSSCPQFDDMLFAILNHVGGIDKFLDVMFSFLYRRTDFFKVKNDSSEKLGLPPGLAQKMVKVISQKYVQLEKAKTSANAQPLSTKAHKETVKSTGEEKPSRKGKKVADKADSTLQNPVLSKHGSTLKAEETSVEAIIETEEKPVKVAKETEEKPVKVSKETEEKPVKVAKETEEKPVKVTKETEEKPVKVAKETEESPVKAAEETEESPIKAANDTEGGPVKNTNKTEEKPAKTSRDTEEAERRYYTSNPECYNGASYDNYCWSQNITDVDVQVKVPDDVKDGGQVKVTIKRTHLKVEVLQDDKWQVLLDGKLLYDVKMEGSTWTLHPHDHVHVQLEKGYDRYWEALLEGEPKINVRTIDCSRPYEDLDQEAQAKLQEMMFDQHQKMLGKPTSQQIKIQEILKKSWDNNNSPFKGQEFDPSLFKMPE